MFNVVLDANHYVSSFIRPDGLQARLFKLACGHHYTILVSEPILQEIYRVLAYPRIQKLLAFTPQEIGEFFESFLEIAEVVEGKLDLHVVKEDPDDDKYISCAVEGGAKVIVSGDNHLLQIGEYQGIRILGTRSFLTENGWI